MSVFQQRRASQCPVPTLTVNTVRDVDNPRYLSVCGCVDTTRTSCLFLGVQIHRVLLVYIYVWACGYPRTSLYVCGHEDTPRPLCKCVGMQIPQVLSPYLFFVCGYLK